MPIHPTFNFVPCSQPKSCHASPNHCQPTTIPHGLMYMLRSNAISISNPTPWPTIWVKPIYLCLVTENHAFPIINDPILIPLNKPQACENTFTTKKWLPLLHLCTQSSLSQSTPYNDVKQQFTCLRSKLFCCCICNSKLTFSNKNDTMPLLLTCKKLWTPSSLSLNVAPTSFLKFATKDWLMHTKTATLQGETLLLSCTKTWCLCSSDNTAIWLQTILQIAPHILWNQGYTMHKKSHNVLNYTMHTTMSMLEVWRQTKVSIATLTTLTFPILKTLKLFHFLVFAVMQLITWTLALIIWSLCFLIWIGSQWEPKLSVCTTYLVLFVTICKLQLEKFKR